MFANLLNSVINGLCSSHREPLHENHYEVGQGVFYKSTTHNRWVRAVVVESHFLKGVQLDIKKDVWVPPDAALLRHREYVVYATYLDP